MSSSIYRLSSPGRCAVSCPRIPPPRPSHTEHASRALYAAAIDGKTPVYGAAGDVLLRPELKHACAHSLFGFL